MLQRDINTGLLLRDTAGVCSSCCAGECTVCTDASKYTPAYVALTLTGSQTQDSCNGSGYGWTFENISTINGRYYIPHCSGCRYAGIIGGTYGTGTHWKPPTCTTLDYTTNYNKLIITVDISYPFGWSAYISPAYYDGTYLTGGPGLVQYRSTEEDPCIFGTVATDAYGVHFSSFGEATLDIDCDSWLSSENYYVGDIVCVGGYTGYYLCIDNNINYYPPDNEEKWEHKEDYLMTDITGYPGYSECGL